MGKFIPFLLCNSPHTHTTHPHTHTHTPVVDFVLKDPRQKEQEQTAPRSTLPHRQELNIVPRPWGRSFVSSREALHENLFVTNPTLNQVLNLWFTKYCSMRLVNSKLLLADEAFELGTYQALIARSIESAKNVLLKK